MKVAFLTLGALALASMAAADVTIDFSSLADGVTVSNQFSGLGATFAAGGLTGSASAYTGNTRDYATNTDMVVSATDTPNGVPAGLRILHTLTGWSNENGQPVFTISFSAPVTHVAIDFYGDRGTDIGTNQTPVSGDSGFYAFNGAINLGLVRSAAGDSTLTNSPKTVVFDGTSITSVVVLPGSFLDPVGVGKVVFTPQAVPEPVSLALLGLGGSALIRRRRN